MSGTIECSCNACDECEHIAVATVHVTVTGANSQLVGEALNLCVPCLINTAIKRNPAGLLPPELVLAMEGDRLSMEVAIVRIPDTPLFSQDPRVRAAIDERQKGLYRHANN